jgi:hypothetical protein
LVRVRDFAGGAPTAFVCPCSRAAAGRRAGVRTLLPPRTLDFRDELVVVRFAEILRAGAEGCSAAFVRTT